MTELEFFEAVGRILEALKLPLTVLIGGGATALVFWFRSRRLPEGDAMHKLTESVNALQGEVQAMRHSLDEVNDRLEFAERALTCGASPETPPR